MARTLSGATAAQDATTNVLTGLARILWVRCDTGTLAVAVRNRDANGSIHDAGESVRLSSGDEHEFLASAENPIISFVPAGVGASATYTFTVRMA